MLYTIYNKDSRTISVSGIHSFQRLNKKKAKFFENVSKTNEIKRPEKKYMFYKKTKIVNCKNSSYKSKELNEI